MQQPSDRKERHQTLDRQQVVGLCSAGLSCEPLCQPELAAGGAWPEAVGGGLGSGVLVSAGSQSMARGGRWRSGRRWQ